MTLSPVSVESFGGLNLVDDPLEIGWREAIDMLNVDLDQRGRLRSRDGYAKFTSAAGANRYHSLAPFYTSTGTKQLVAARTNAIDALNTAGGVVASQAVVAGINIASMARFAAPGLEHIYVSAANTASNADTVYRWDGAAWSVPAWTGTTPQGRLLGVYPADSGARLVNARFSTGSAGTNASSVRFSYINPGPPAAPDPTTWQANDYVDIAPGDGEEITALESWTSLLFAFKETKFFVFYGTSTDASGNPIFNSRAVVGQGLPAVGGASAYRATTAAPHGVYFVNRRGIWLTTGGPATLVSHKFDPIFRGNVSSFFQSSALNQAQIGLCSLHWHDNRLYFAYPSGSATANDRVIVFDPDAQTWALFDIPCSDMASFRVADAEELMFSYASGTNDIGRHSMSYTDDAGTAITSRYRSGFSDLGTPLRKRVREWILEGVGSPTLKTSFDLGSLETGAAVTLGVSPAVAEQRRRYASRGRHFSFQVGATTAWSLNNLVAHVDERRAPGTHSTT